MMPTRVNPYLVMNGNARDAVTFYEQALKAKVLGVMTFGQMPPDPDNPLPEEAKNLVTHAQLKIGDTDLMLCDTFPGQPHIIGNQVNVCVTSSDADTSKVIYDALQQGGQVLMPLQKTFWSPAYAMVKDKYGVTFHISTESPHQ